MRIQRSTFSDRPLSRAPPYPLWRNADDGSPRGKKGWLREEPGNIWINGRIVETNLQVIGYQVCVCRQNHLEMKLQML